MSGYEYDTGYASARVSGYGSDSPYATAQGLSAPVATANRNITRAHSTKPIAFVMVPSALSAEQRAESDTWYEGEFSTWDNPFRDYTAECDQRANLTRAAYQRRGDADQGSLLDAIQASLNTVPSDYGFRAIAVDAGEFETEWQKFKTLVDKSTRSAKPCVGFLAMSVEKKEPTEVSRWVPNEAPNSGYSKVNLNQKPTVWYRACVFPTDDASREEIRARISYMATRLDTLSGCSIPNERVKRKVLKELPDCQIVDFSRGFLG